METIELKSEKELFQIMNCYPCHSVLDEDSFSKTRYIPDSDYDALIKYHLVYEPYVAIAEKCRMRAVPIMRSPKTNRFILALLIQEGIKQFVNYDLFVLRKYAIQIILRKCTQTMVQNWIMG